MRNIFAKHRQYNWVVVFIFFFFFVPDIQGVNKFDSIAYQIEWTRYSNKSKAQLYLEELYSLAANHPDSIKLAMQCLYWEAAINDAQGINDTALLRKTNEYLTEINAKQYPFENALLHYTLALGEMNQGNYNKSLPNVLDAYGQFNALRDTVFIVKTLNSLGNLCHYISSYTLAEDYYEQARALSSPSRIEHYIIPQNIYMAWSFMPERIYEAIDSLQAFLPTLEQSHDTGLITLAYLNLGTFYHVVENFEGAFEWYERVSEMLPQIENNKRSFALHQNMGMYYYRMGDYEKSLLSFQKAESIASTEGNQEQLPYALLGLSDIYETMGEADSACYYLKRYHQANNDLLNNAKVIEAYQSYAAILLESSQKELTIAEQRSMLNHRRFLIALISALGGGLLIIIILLRQRLKVVENRELSLKLKQEESIRQLKEESHQEAIEAKIREITSYSLLLVTKNNILQRIHDLVNNATEGKESVKTMREQVKQVIKSSQDSEQEWNNFMSHFDKVHPRFFDKLKSINPELTENNLRVCAYFRIGLSTKEVAQLLNISADTSRTNRHRLKKKLGIAEEDNLENFLRNI